MYGPNRIKEYKDHIFFYGPEPEDWFDTSGVLGMKAPASRESLLFCKKFREFMRERTERTSGQKWSSRFEPEYLISPNIERDRMRYDNELGQFDLHKYGLSDEEIAILEEDQNLAEYLKWD